MDKNDDNNTIHKSFSLLINIIEKGNKNKKKKEENDFEGNINDNFTKEFFCCKECYDKFIEVMKKIKENKIDLTKIDWGKYGNDSSNIIVKLVTYYYNLGLQNSNN